MSIDGTRTLVLLASFNGMPWISAQLESLIAQRGTRVDILISDDGSTDGTREFVQRAALGHPGIALLPAAVASGSACANFLRLIATARTDGFSHVALCDQDDVWDHDKIGRAVTLLDLHDAALYSSAVRVNAANRPGRVLEQSSHQTGYDFLFEGAGQGCTYVMSARHFSKIQSFVSAHAELLEGLHYHDWLIYSLTCLWNERWVCDSRPSMTYRQHGSNDTGARGGWSGWAKRWALVRSGWYRAQTEKIFAVCTTAAPLDARLRRAAAWRRLRRHAGLHLIWAAWLLVVGRRRLSDRCALFVFGLFRLV